MSLSIANDFDVQYDKGDLDRFAAIFPAGPTGIFLKETFDVGISGRHLISTDQRLTFGKAFVYPAVAAPFVVLGGVWGLFVLNCVLLALSLTAVFAWGRALGGLAGAAFGTAFLLLSVAPVYVAWLGPEIFNLTLVTLAYFRTPYQKEGEGVWVPGGETWQTLVKMDRRPRHVRLTFTSPIANTVSGSFDSKPFSASVGPGGSHVVQLAPGAGFKYHQNVVYLMALKVRNSFVPSQTDPASNDLNRPGNLGGPSV